MPEIKQNFTKGKMNKDLDERLIPKGEYREAQNIHITESEGSDVGAIENVLGNTKVTGTIAPAYDTPGYPSLLEGEGYEVIGYCKDLANKRIVYFITNFESTAFVDNIRTIPRAQNAGTSSYSASIVHDCAIILYDIENKATNTLVYGSWLNFSKNHLITGAQIIDDLLFWTDNYNQPRKINIQLALDNYVDDSDQYYDCEETVSIAKYAPYAPLMTFKSEGTIVTGNADIGIVTTNATGITDGVYNITLGVTSGVTTSGDGDGVAIEVTVSSGTVTTVNITSVGSNFLAGDTITISGTVLTGASNSVVLTIRIEDLNHNQTNSLDNSVESDYLKERFVRFSYRYKYDDGEYSLIAPFTQSIFEPLNSGIITNSASDDEKNSTTDEPAVLTGKKEVYKKGIVDIMQNRINKIEFRIPLPNKDEFKTNSLNYSSYANPFHIKEIEVLLKESNGISFKIVKTIKIDEITSSDIETYQVAPSGTVYYRQALKYTYSSSEPYKVLPESEVTRVYDQVPLMAKALEVVGNRVVFGNYVENYPYPVDINNKKGINYSVNVVTKGDIDQSYDIKQWMHKTYKYHTLKQRRTYQVGIVLVDAFGRQSPVILSSNTDSLNADTITTDPVSTNFETTNPSTNGSWSGSRQAYGNSLKLTFEDSIISSDSKFIANMIYGAGYNPHGWYSYRLVVKQTEQEYYNVYASHTFDGWNNISEDTDDTLTGGRSWLALHGDNVNKVPRSLNDTDLNRDGTMGSNARLYPKVVFDTNGESKMNSTYHELAEVISLGTAFEQNLFLSGDDNKSGTGGFSVYDFVYGKNKNPLMAELQNMKAYTGGTSNNAAIVLFSDAEVTTATNSIVLADDQLGNNASFSDDAYNDYNINSTSLNLGKEVTVTDSVSSTSTITLSSKQVFDEGDKIVLSKYYEGLSVFETEPFESKIDIYYETSTCGLLSDLVEYIDIDPATLPSNLRIYQDTYDFGDGQDPVGSLNEQYGVLAYLYENTVSGTNIGDLSATKEASGSGVLTFSINRATREQDGADVSNLFTIIYDSGDSKYKLQTSGAFVFRNNTYDNITISVAVSDPDSGTKYLDIFVNVKNTVPSITAPTGPLSISTIAGADVEVVNTDNDIENGGTIIVGAVTKYTGLTVTFDFGNSDFNSYFYLDDNAPQGKYIFKTSNEWTVSNAEDFFTNSEANRTVTFTVTDAYGLTDTASVVIDEYSNVIVSGYLSRADSVNTYCESYSATIYYATPGTGDDPIIYGEAPELYNGNILYTDSAITTLAPAGVYISYNTQNTAWIYEVDSSGVVSVYSSFSEYDDC